MMKDRVFEMRVENASETEKYFYKFAGEGLRYEMVEFLERIGGSFMLNITMNSIVSE